MKTNLFYTLFLVPFVLIAQETNPVSGGEATGSRGAVSYTVGQLVYTNSTTGVSGSSESITVNNKSYLVQQSIGQASVIGTFNNAGYTLRQGFIQPNVLAKIVDANMSIDLEVIFYPNPFIESATLAFTETIKGTIEIGVFDMLGRLVFSNTYNAEQNLEVQFKNLSVADYILKVTANNKQFVKSIIKK
jgi:hypothetical protein